MFRIIIFYDYIYMYTYISLSSHIGSTDFPDSLSLSLYQILLRIYFSSKLKKQEFYHLQWCIIQPKWVLLGIYFKTLQHWNSVIKTNTVTLYIYGLFANGPGDRGSIPGPVIPKTQKMVLDAALLNTQFYSENINGKVEQSRERSSALPYTS